MKSHKSADHFHVVGHLISNNTTNKFTHITDIVLKKSTDQTITKPKYKYRWIRKTELDHRSAVREVVAQELFRLLLPSHPKTRLIPGNSQRPSYVLSKEVPGFKSFNELGLQNVAKGILNGTYRGLGGVTLVALLVNERDLKKGNIGVDENGNIVKIDGNCCLKNDMQTESDFQITESLIDSLPGIYQYSKEELNSNTVHQYHPFNWLDTLISNKFTDKNHRIFDVGFSMYEPLRKEVNQAILKISLLSVSFLREFINSYAQSMQQRYELLDQITSTRRAIILAAINNPSYQNYLNSKDANIDAYQFLDHLKNFNTTGKNKLNTLSIQQKIYIKLGKRNSANSRDEQAEQKQDIAPSNQNDEITRTEQQGGATRSPAISNPSISPLAAFSVFSSTPEWGIKIDSVLDKRSMIVRI